jgi:hypothetical protein
LREGAHPHGPAALAYETIIGSGQAGAT